MAAATSFGDCVRFAAQLSAVGGALPKRLQGLFIRVGGF